MDKENERNNALFGQKNAYITSVAKRKSNEPADVLDIKRRLTAYVARHNDYKIVIGILHNFLSKKS